MKILQYLSNLLDRLDKFVKPFDDYLDKIGDKLREARGISPQSGWTNVTSTEEVEDRERNRN